MNTQWAGWTKKKSIAEKERGPHLPWGLYTTSNSKQPICIVDICWKKQFSWNDLEYSSWNNSFADACGVPGTYAYTTWLREIFCLNFVSFANEPLTNWVILLDLWILGVQFGFPVKQTWQGKTCPSSKKKGVQNFQAVHRSVLRVKCDENSRTYFFLPAEQTWLLQWWQSFACELPWGNRCINAVANKMGKGHSALGWRSK